METKNIAIAVVGIIIFLAIATVFFNNDMFVKSNDVKEAWSNVETAYENRLDTVPNFVKTAKFSTEFQERLAINYAKARQQLNDPAVRNNPDAYQKIAEDSLKSMVITVNAEAVPEAKLDQLTELNGEVDTTARVVRHQRDAYNAKVTIYNNAIGTLPGSLFAKTLGFYPREYFKASAEASVAPVVNL